jgi:hypothetical protein
MVLGKDYLRVERYTVGCDVHGPRPKLVIWKKYNPQRVVIMVPVVEDTIKMRVSPAVMARQLNN